MNINFESTYEDYLLNKVHEQIANFSVNTLFIELNKTIFETLILKEFPDCAVYEKTEYLYSKTTNNLEPYTTKALIKDDFAVIYAVTNYNEDSDVTKDFDYDKDGDFVASNINFYFNNKSVSKIKEIIKELKGKIVSFEVKNRFYTIGADQNGFKLVPEKTNLCELDIELNYGSKFKAVHDEIYEALKTQYSGLLLLHGEPGTGKTTYIRHLISLLSNDKKIIYVPTYLVEQLANPEFISFIQRFKESILILEDAEFVLQSRQEEYGAQAVSNLLNITNGLLNDVTKIQVIATFNMDKKNIDKALLRPGRLLKEWKFDKLCLDDAKALAKSLNKDINITSAMTLAEIYSGKTQTKKHKKRIGINED